MQIERAPWSSYSVDFSALQEAVEQDPYSGLHSHLYHLLALCQQDVFEQMTEKVMMQKQGHKQILEHLKITRFDLCYNPKRYESWERVLSKSSKSKFLIQVVQCVIWSVAAHAQNSLPAITLLLDVHTTLHMRLYMVYVSNS